MRQEEKLSLMLEHIRKYMALDDPAELAVRTGILDALLRIHQIEKEEKDAHADIIELPVEKVQEGFAFWNQGGYDPQAGTGTAMVAAGMDGWKLRRLRTVSERNGRHALVIVYPGCLIAEARAADVYVPYLAIHRIIGFSGGREAGYVARCRPVWKRSPSFVNQVDEHIVERLINVTGDLALDIDAYKMDW